METYRQFLNSIRLIGWLLLMSFILLPLFAICMLIPVLNVFVFGKIFNYL